MNDEWYRFWSRLGITLLVLFVFLVAGITTVMVTLSQRDWLVW